MDAAFFHLYGIPRDDTAYILNTFPVLETVGGDVSTASTGRSAWCWRPTMRWRRQRRRVYRTNRLSNRRGGRNERIPAPSRFDVQQLPLFRRSGAFAGRRYDRLVRRERRWQDRVALPPSPCGPCRVPVRRSPRFLKLDSRRDPYDAHSRREGAARAGRTGAGSHWTAAIVGQSESVRWSSSASPRVLVDPRTQLQAIHRCPGSASSTWRTLAVVRDGTASIGFSVRHQRPTSQGRAYWWTAGKPMTSALDPNLDEAPRCYSGSRMRCSETWSGGSREEPERFFHAAVMEATVKATPGVTNAWYDPVEQGPEGAVRRTDTWLRGPSCPTATTYSLRWSPTSPVEPSCSTSSMAPTPRHEWRGWCSSTSSIFTSTHDGSA